MRSFFIFPFLVFCFFCNSFSSVGNVQKKIQVLYYGPVKTTVSGEIEIQTFPGAPGYLDVSQGDEVERGWYLRIHPKARILKRILTDQNINDVDECCVRVLQLVFSVDRLNWPVIKKKLLPGAKVKIVGELFHAWSGHHHAKILISVKTIEFEENSK
jgi:hypothetical protein